MKDNNTNTKEEEEVFDGEKDIYEVESTKYLGQIISQDGIFFFLILSIVQIKDLD